VKRWTTILGRGGTTLIAISLALLLVSIIPQPQLSSTEGRTPLLPDQLSIVFTPGALTPQQELQLAVTVEGTLKVYLLEISVEFRLGEGIFELGFNLTDLQELEEEHPDKIIWEDPVENSDYERSFTPTRVMNATVVFYNPSSEIAIAEYDIALKSSLAPGEKVQTIAYWAAPIGIILASPWLLNIWKQRKHK
jgi:hypothetical protein